MNDSPGANFCGFCGTISSGLALGVKWGQPRLPLPPRAQVCPTCNALYNANYMGVVRPHHYGELLQNPAPSLHACAGPPSTPSTASSATYSFSGTTTSINGANVPSFSTSRRSFRSSSSPSASPSAPGRRTPQATPQARDGLTQEERDAFLAQELQDREFANADAHTSQSPRPSPRTPRPSPRPSAVDLDALLVADLQAVELSDDIYAEIGISMPPRPRSSFSPSRRSMVALGNPDEDEAVRQELEDLALAVEIHRRELALSDGIAPHPIANSVLFGIPDDSVVEPSPPILRRVRRPAGTRRSQPQQRFDFDGGSYQELLQLDAQNVRVGLSPAQVNALPTVSHTPNSSDTQCSICLENFRIGGRLTALPCLHRFHHQCIATALQSKKECPICRKEVVV